MKTIKLLAVAVLAAVGATGIALIPVVPAHADIAPGVAFGTTEMSVPFGGDWLVELQIAAPEGYVIDSTWGTVDIQIDDVAGIYSAALPIMRGGLVYFARPESAPLLAAGEHRATAVFRPGTGGLLEAQTATPLVITVTPLALSPTIDILDVPGDEASPYAELALTGPFVDALGTPAGTWAVSAELEGESVLETSVDVAAGAGPVTVSLADYVRPGRTLVVSGIFTPDAAVAGGIQATEIPSVEVATPALTPTEWLTRSIAVPWWLLAISLVLVVGAIIAAIIVVVRARRRASASDSGVSEPSVDTAPEAAPDVAPADPPAPDDEP